MAVQQRQVRAVEEVEDDEKQVIRVTLKGEDLGTFSDRRMSTSESILMKQRTGLSFKAFVDGIGELDGEAMNALVWLLKHRKGESVDVRTLTFEYGDLQMEMEPDPTQLSKGSGGSAT